MNPKCFRDRHIHVPSFKNIWESWKVCFVLLANYFRTAVPYISCLYRLKLSLFVSAILALYLLGIGIIPTFGVLYSTREEQSYSTERAIIKWVLKIVTAVTVCVFSFIFGCFFWASPIPTERCLSLPCSSQWFNQRALDRCLCSSTLGNSQFGFWRTSSEQIGIGFKPLSISPLHVNTYTNQHNHGGKIYA